MPNVERLKLLRETVLRNPEQWNQANWAALKSCGTQLCLAGWACSLAGREINWSDYDDVESSVHAWGIATSGTLVPTEEELSRGATRVWISNVAEEWLDLTPEQANDLFYSANEDQALEVLDDLIFEAKAGRA